MKTEIIKIYADWKDVKNVSRTTVNKDYSSKNATVDFKKKMLLSEHSPIRLINIRWKWSGIKSWISVHWVRHRFEKYVSTQRSDRTGVSRDKLPQDALVNFEGYANAQNLIDAWRKRLCHQTAKETREYAEDFKVSLLIGEKELSDVLVPNCIYRNGCPEFNNCKYHERLLNQNPKIGSYNIQERYDAYNEIFLTEYNNEVK